MTNKNFEALYTEYNELIQQLQRIQHTNYTYIRLHQH